MVTFHSKTFFSCYPRLQDENSNYRPVCSFITPLRAGRLLDTPRQAMRFVSLVRYEKQQTLGGGDKLEQWSTLHAFLSRNKGVRLNFSGFLSATW